MTMLTAMPKYESYRWSGNDFFGDIPTDWNTVPLCKIAQLKSITNKANEQLLSVYLDKGVIRFDDVEEKRTNVTSLDLSKYQLVEKGDFVLNNQQAWRGSVGVSEYMGIVSPAYLVLGLSPELNSIFANYLFRDGSMVSQYLVCSKGVGTIQRNLYWPHLRRTIVALPSLSEQTAIANFLDEKTAKIDEAIAIKEKQIELLKERKQIIIQQAVTQGLDPTVPMKDSGVEWIGKIPAHWRLMSLRYAFEFMDHKRLPLSAIEREKKKGIYPYYGASGIIDFIDEYIFDQSLLLIAEDGANLLSKSTPLCFIATGKYWVNNHAHVLKPKFGDLVYWAELLSCFDYTVYITGAAQPKLSRDNLGGIFIPVPPLSELENITKFIENIKPAYNQNIDTLMKQISYLKEYKTTLINSAVTGKIKVV